MKVVALTWDLELEVFPDGVPTNNYDIEWNTLMASLDLGFATLKCARGRVEPTDMDYNDENITYSIVSLTDMPSDTTTQEIRWVSEDGPIEWLVGYLDMDSDARNNPAHNHQIYGEFMAYEGD